MAQVEDGRAGAIAVVDGAEGAAGTGEVGVPLDDAGADWEGKLAFTRDEPPRGTLGDLECHVPHPDGRAGNGLLIAREVERALVERGQIQPPLRLGEPGPRAVLPLDELLLPRGRGGLDAVVLDAATDAESAARERAARADPEGRRDLDEVGDLSERREIAIGADDDEAAMRTDLCMGGGEAKDDGRAALRTVALAIEGRGRQTSPPLPKARTLTFVAPRCSPSLAAHGYSGRGLQQQRSRVAAPTSGKV